MYLIIAHTIYKMRNKIQAMKIKLLMKSEGKIGTNKIIKYKIILTFVYITHSLHLHWDFTCWISHLATKTGFWIYYIWNGNGTEQSKHNRQSQYTEALLCANRLHTKFFCISVMCTRKQHTHRYIYSGHNGHVQHNHGIMTQIFLNTFNKTSHQKLGVNTASLQLQRNCE